MTELSPFDTQAVAAAKPVADLASLMALDDAAFLGAAYLSLLRRPADADGLGHYLSKLRSGNTKIEVLAALCASREGRSNGAQLPGLNRALSRYRLSRTPLLGGLLRWFNGGEGYTADQRRQRAIEQLLLRQLVQSQQQHTQMLAHLVAVKAAVAQGGSGQASAAEARIGELIVQPRGQTPSVLSNFIKLKRTPADDVLAQLAELVNSSLEAEQLATGRA